MNPRTLGIAIVSVMLLTTLVTLQLVTQQKLDRAQRRALIAETHIVEVLQTLGDVQVERDSLRRVADSAGARRVAPEARARATFAALPPARVPTGGSDPCEDWIARANQAIAAADDALTALSLANAEVAALRKSDTVATTAITRSVTTLEEAKPVVQAATHPPGRSFGARLLKVLTPVVGVEYGAFASIDPGSRPLRISTDFGFQAFVGWQIALPLSKVF